MARTYSYEQLAKKSQSELDQIKQNTLEALAEANQKRWDTVGAILFYQSEIEKVKS